MAPDYLKRAVDGLRKVSSVLSSEKKDQFVLEEFLEHIKKDLFLSSDRPQCSNAWIAYNLASTCASKPFYEKEYVDLFRKYLKKTQEEI